MDTETLFPYILLTAWEKKIPLVSNILSHYGVMIGAYPNPSKYGGQIVDMLYLHIKAGKTWKPHVDLAKTSSLTFNNIYASQLGIKLPPPLRKEIIRIYE